MNLPLILLIVFVVALSWGYVLMYSKRTYTLLPCKKCKGSGKIFEPFWMAWACGRRTRAYYKCELTGDTKRSRYFM